MPRLLSYDQEYSTDSPGLSGLYGYNSEHELTLTLEHVPN